MGYNLRPDGEGTETVNSRPAADAPTAVTTYDPMVRVLKPPQTLSEKLWPYVTTYDPMVRVLKPVVAAYLAVPKAAVTTYDPMVRVLKRQHRGRPDAGEPPVTTYDPMVRVLKLSILRERVEAHGDHALQPTTRW